MKPIDAISTLYKVKFAELISRFNDMERKYIGLHESWHDMNPLMKDKDNQMEMDFQEEELNMDLKDNVDVATLLGEKMQEVLSEYFSDDKEKKQ